MWKKTYTRNFGPIFEYCNDMLSTMISKDSFSFEFEMRITTRLCLDSTAKSYCRALCFWIYCRQVSKDSAWFKKQEVTVCVCVCMYMCFCIDIQVFTSLISFILNAYLSWMPSICIDNTSKKQSSKYSHLFATVCVKNLYGTRMLTVSQSLDTQNMYKRW